MAKKQINFYTRPGCHLCEDALEVLQELRGEFKFDIEIVDISDSPELVSLYGKDIPVAELGGRRIFKHRADPRSLRRVLDRKLGLPRL